MYGCILRLTLCAGACGQLVVEHNSKQGCNSESSADMEDLSPAVKVM